MPTNLLITSDNPRSEDPAAIIAEIATGACRSTAPRREPDRAAAIRLAPSMRAGPGDCVLIAGKGHEDYQEASGVRARRSAMPA
jgi:UDP-N-acetylmuramyl tripeptide synthase